MPNVLIKVSNVDDGVNVLVNGTEIMHVDFLQSNTRDLVLDKGDRISLIIQNLTGGAWHADFTITVDGKTIYKKTPQGWSLPGQPQAFLEEIIV